VRAYYMFRVPLNWHEQVLDTKTLEHTQRNLKRQLTGWAPSLLSPIDACHAVVPRPIMELPIGHRWPHRMGATLLGDAAHLMTPLSGEGVNMTMLDAAELALALTENQDSDAAIAHYEEQMFARAAEAAAGAHEGLALVSDNGLQHVLDHFQPSTEPPPVSWTGSVRQDELARDVQEEAKTTIVHR